MLYEVITTDREIGSNSRPVIIVETMSDSMYLNSFDKFVITSYSIHYTKLYDTLVHAAPRWQRGKIARAIAAKAVIAARVDVYGEGLNKTLLEKLDVRVKEIGTKYEKPTEREPRRLDPRQGRRDFDRRSGGFSRREGDSRRREVDSRRREVDSRRREGSYNFV